MPFDAQLRALVAETGAEMAIFCDYEAEAISFASREMDDYDVRISGAQLGALILRLQKPLREAGLPERVSLAFTAERRTFLIEALPGGYYVVLTLEPGQLWPRARSALRRVADRFLPEL